jgi:hypothetical protein
MIYLYTKVMKIQDRTTQTCLSIKSRKGGRKKHAGELNRNTKGRE